jgi:predicted GIY-YIG superfamily endonuclease
MFHEETFYRYIMTNKNHTVIYIGFSGQIKERVHQLKINTVKGLQIHTT